MADHAEESHAREGSGSDPMAIVAVGGSAGAIEPLIKVVSELPEDLPAAVLVVMHLPPYAPSLLASILGRHSRLTAERARDRASLRPGTIVVAPPDHHLLVSPGTVRLGHGPKENGSRPAIDPLFRSAAATYGPRTIAVLLSGVLDDGTIGMVSVHRAGGVTVVQDPEEALYPGMPASAIENVQVDHVVRADEMPELIVKLARARAEEGVPEMVERISLPPPFAEGGGGPEESDVPGEPTGFTCPECHGAIWEVTGDGVTAYRCRIGHTYSPATLLAEQTDDLEAALWVALRALEEGAGLQRRLAERMRSRGNTVSAERFEREATLTEERAKLIRQVLEMEATRDLKPLAEDVALGTLGDELETGT